MSWSYMGHVIATVPNKSSTAYRQGYCSLVRYYVCPDTSHVASCQGSRGTGRGLVWRVGSTASSVIKGTTS
ncbi:hypothetical protein BHM03_00026839 [Ensete ventricosum]|nr:hypothetical protein BHM03_00026839 [Ensete ventricosum]